MKTCCDGGGWDAENTMTELGELLASYQAGGTDWRTSPQSPAGGCSQSHHWADGASVQGTDLAEATARPGHQLCFSVPSSLLPSLVTNAYHLHTPQISDSVSSSFTQNTFTATPSMNLPSMSQRKKEVTRWSILQLHVSKLQTHLLLLLSVARVVPPPM